MESHSDLNAAGRSRRSQSQSPSQSAASASVTSSSRRKRKLPPSSNDHASPFPPSSLATFSAETNDDLDSTSAAGGGAEDSDYNEGSDVAVDDDEDDHDASSIRNFTASRLKNVGVASAADRRNKKVKIDDSVKVKTPEAGKDGGGGAARTNSDSMGASGTALGGVGKEDTEKGIFTDNIQKSGAYSAREEILKREEEAGRLKFTCVSDDGRDEHMVWLIDLKNIFSKQLPKMPKEYIVRLVMDRNHKSVIIIRKGHVVGGITYRPYIRQKFGEMVFCAIAANEQVKGYGTRLMNHLKQYARDVDGLTHFLTYADNNAVGYFVKQGFTKEIGMDKDRWHGYIKDYDGGTLMECKIDPKLPYTDLSSMIRQQRMVLDAKIRKLSSCHMVYDGLDFQKKEGGVNTKAVKPEDIPGLREAGWTPDQYGHSRFDVLMKEDGGSNTKCLIAFMNSLLKAMLEHSDVWPFKEPVDAHDVPDYYNIIQNPMDLKTMSQRVESEQYPTFEMFIADAKRMFANARTYNSPETIFYKCAARLETYFLSKVQTGLQSLVKRPP